MEIPVLIEPLAGNGFRARGGEPLALSAEGSTAQEALQRLQELLRSRLATGMQIVSLEVPAREHPLASSAGIFKADDPLVQEWEQIMAENRKRADEDPDVL